MSESYEQFIELRNHLLSPEPESAQQLAQKIVELFELIAIHGSSGIGGRQLVKDAYIDQLTKRIMASCEPDF